MTDEWKEKLSKAGFESDGHVTNGSLSAQTLIVDEMLEEFIARLELIGDQCLAGGHKSRSRMFRALAKSFKVRYLKI